ncbi:MAG: T9SS type A sorting domain-containing protein [Flavobacteriales bacterium]
MSCGGSPTNDAFAWFIPTSDSTTITLVPQNNADVAFQVFTGSCGALTLLACVNDKPAAGFEQENIYTPSGPNYLIRVMTMGPLDSLTGGVLCVEQTLPPPSNGSPCSATYLPVTTRCDSAIATDNYSSLTTMDINDPDRSPGCSGDVWFTTVVPSTGHLIIDTQCLHEMDGGMSLYTSTGGCAAIGNSDWVAFNDDSSSTGNLMPKLNFPDDGTLTPGDTVYLRFWAYGGAEDDFRICASSDITTLPVDFIAFQAQAHNDVVDVTWSTATEQNSDHFVIERSMDNSIFEGIGEMPAAGESSNRHDYSFTDMTPPLGTVYYRVREVDHDGSSMFTSTVVAFPTASSDAPLLYPNPAVDLLNVAFTAERSGNARIEVVDALGRTLIAQQLDGERGRRAAQVDLHGLAPGYYSARITLPSGEVLRAGGFIKR